MKRLLLAWTALAVIPLACASLQGLSSSGLEATATMPAQITTSPTPTLSPTSSPTPTPQPTPATIGPDSLGQVQRLHDYLPVIEAAVGADRFSMDIYSTAYSPDGRYVAVGGCVTVKRGFEACYDLDGSLEGGRPFLLILDAHTEAVLAQIPDDKPNTTFWDLAFSHDGSTLFYSIYYPDPGVIHPAGKVAVWDMASQQVRSVLWQGETQGPSVAVSPDDRLLAILTSNHVDIWDTAAAKYAAHLDGGKPPRFAEFSRDGSSFAFYHNWDGAIVVYDTAAWHEMARVSIPFQSSFDVSPDHSLMALSDDSSTSILDVTSDEQIRLLRDDLEYAQALVFTPDGRLLLAYDVIGGTGLADAWETSSWERVGGGETLWTHGFARGQFADDGRTFLSYQWLEEIALYGLP